MTAKKEKMMRVNSIKISTPRCIRFLVRFSVATTNECEPRTSGRHRQRDTRKRNATTAASSVMRAESVVGVKPLGKTLKPRLEDSQRASCTRGEPWSSARPQRSPAGARPALSRVDSEVEPERVAVRVALQLCGAEGALFRFLLFLSSRAGALFSSRFL